MTIWGDYVQIPHTVLKTAIKINRNNMFFTNYDDIVNEPQELLDAVCDFLNIEKYNGYQFTNIINSQPEKDENGWKLKDLHVIRPELKKISIPPAQIIGSELTNYFSQFNLVV